MRRDYREDDKRLEALMSQQEVIDMYLSYFRNLPMITKNVIGEVTDVYGQFCEEEITEDELLEDKDKYIYIYIYLNAKMVLSVKSMISA